MASRSSTLPFQFRNRRAAGQDQVGPSREIRNGNVPGVNAEVAVNRGQEISRSSEPLDDLLPMLVRRANDAPGFDAAPPQKLGKRARPVIAPRLNGSRRPAGHPPAAAGGSLD